MYCNQEIETMPRARMVQLQTKKLQKTVEWAYEKSAFYRAKMAEVGLSGKSIQTLADLIRLPFTTKEELMAVEPLAFLTGPISSTIRMRMVGKHDPITRAYTRNDVAHNVEMMARCLVAGGVNRASVLQISENYTSENALSMQYAAEILGATVVPSANTELEYVLATVDRLGVTMLASDSQRMLQVLIAGQALEYDLKAAKIERLFLLNDTVKNNMQGHLTSRFNAEIFNFYAPLELGSAGMAFDCDEKKGMHLQEDYFYPEVISLTDQQPLENGRVGELVLTALDLEAMPVLRYRTGQIVSLNAEVCPCGRTLSRIQAP